MEFILCDGLVIALNCMHFSPAQISSFRVDQDIEETILECRGCQNAKHNYKGDSKTDGLIWTPKTSSNI